MGNWKTIRLELARTDGFPSGSVSRGYLMELPLQSDGRVDTGAVAEKPHRATVRRYWSTEPDQLGLLVPGDRAWSMQCKGALQRTLMLDDQPVRLGEQLSIVEADGAVLPFTIASIG